MTPRNCGAHTVDDGDTSQCPDKKAQQETCQSDVASGAASQKRTSMLRSTTEPGSVQNESERGEAVVKRLDTVKRWCAACHRHVYGKDELECPVCSSPLI